jgi:hypothetical protein
MVDEVSYPSSGVCGPRAAVDDPFPRGEGRMLSLRGDGLGVISASRSTVDFSEEDWLQWSWGSMWSKSRSRSRYDDGGEARYLVAHVELDMRWA